VNILIAEDHPTNRKLLRAQLEVEGHTVIETCDGAEALEALRHGGIDLLISDILMPNLDGYRLCHEIRTLESASHLPIILYTSTYNSQADRDVAEIVGADLYLSKPAPHAVLMDAIERAMARKNDRAAAPMSAQNETYVLKRYSAALVRKLEDKNAELEAALEEVSRSQIAILDLNAELESRVEQRTRQLADANRELEAFSFTVSHDLRAPLRRIDGFAHVLESHRAGPVDEEDRVALGIILRSVRQMGELINDLLAFSRTNRAELRHQAVNLDEIVDDVLASMAEDMQGRRLVWHRQALPQVEGDPALLRQVFVNVLGNAVKYTRPRDPAEIRIGWEHGEDGSVLVAVSDNGVGFDPEYAEKLFGVFQRLHREDEFEGTGIGLAIAQRVIERHGGRIWAESTPGEGAAFFFTLPVVRTAAIDS
jgi:signal transduction histidine kinase